MTTQKSKASISLQESAFTELAIVAKHAENLQKIREAASQATPAENLSHFTQRIAEKVGAQTSDILRIVNALSNLRIIKEKNRLTADEIVDATTAAIEQQTSESWRNKNLQGWHDAKDILVQLVDELGGDHPLAISQKAARLTYTQQNILTDVEIITDVRPVFNTSGDKILEAIITHSFVAEYSDGENTKTIHLSMDANDVAIVRRLCERAEKKAITLKESLKPCAWETIVIGERDGN